MDYVKGFLGLVTGSACTEASVTSKEGENYCKI
jgi:hypothetical protein